MKSSVLDGANPLTDLRPGETGLRLKDDPYYGKVDLGAAPAEDDGGKLRDFEKKEREKIAAMPHAQQATAEEKLGRDLAKRQKASSKSGATKPIDPDAPPAASKDDLMVALGYLEEVIDSGAHTLDASEQNHIEVLTGKRLQARAPVDSPREPEEVTEPDGGEAAAKEASARNPLEPAERDRDKTKAAKPGESAKS